MNKWKARFIHLAYHIAEWSKDPNTKCGAVITEGNRVISLGFNGFPMNTNDAPALYTNREEKYRRVIHAEKNAILFAQRPLVCCTMYVVPIPPCSQCAGMIVQTGITRVVTIKPSPAHVERWGDDIDSTIKMFDEAGIVMEYYNDEEPII
jgi:dCMP deaminase